jgi:hypothetical protein
VAAARQHHRARFAQTRRIERRGARVDHAVVVAPQQQRGRTDIAQQRLHREGLVAAQAREDVALEGVVGDAPRDEGAVRRPRHEGRVGEH